MSETRLGIDYGTRQVGLAVGDPVAGIAFPRGVLRRTTDAALIAEIVALCAREDIGEIVLGWPLHMDGGAGAAAAAVEAFAELLRSQVAVPVVLWDERWSTLAAQRDLSRAGVSTRRQRGMIDQAAAQLILSNYLESLNQGRTSCISD